MFEVPIVWGPVQRTREKRIAKAEILAVKNLMPKIVFPINKN